MELSDLTYTEVIEPKYALLTFGEYFKLNKALSDFRGWQLGNKTERADRMNPSAAKINIQHDTDGNEISYEEAVVMRISSDIQLNNPELIERLELVSSYIPSESGESLAIDKIDITVADWTLNHCEKQGVNIDKLVTYVASQNAENYPIIPNEGEWCEKRVYKYGDNKAKCLQPHTRTFRTPEEEPALWLVIETISQGSYPDWVQPTGAHDAYQTDDIVSYNDGLWISRINANVTVPDGDEPYNRYWEPYTE